MQYAGHVSYTNFVMALLDDGGPGRPNLWGVQIRWDTGKSLPRLHGCVIKLKAEMKNKVAFWINCEFLSKRKKSIAGLSLQPFRLWSSSTLSPIVKIQTRGETSNRKSTFLLTWYTFFHHLLLHLLCTVVVALTCTGRKIIYFCLSWIFLSSNYQRLTINGLDKTKKKIK